jgi:hypothetical protein
MPRSFVLEPCKPDVSAAEKYGKVTYVFGPEYRRCSIWDDAFPATVMLRLRELGYNPEEDYLVIAGHVVPLVQAVVTCIVEWGHINVLFFSATDRDYIARRLGGSHVNGFPAALQAS